MKAIILTALYLFCNNVFGQFATIKSADRAYKNLKYLEAIAQYEQLLESKNANRDQILFPLAYSCKKINDPVRAEKYFALIALSDTAVNSKLYYAQALAANGKYNVANDWYQKYASANKSDVRGNLFANGLNNFDKFFADSAYIKVDLLNVNTPQSDFSPAIYKNGFVFVSGRGGTNPHRVFGWNNTAFLDLYYVKDTATVKPAIGELLSILNSNPKDLAGKVHDDETRQTANDSPVLGYLSDNNSTINNNPDTIRIKKFSSSVNTKFHDGPVAFYASGDTMLFTRNSYNGIATKKSKDGTVRLQIYMAKFRNGSWTDLEQFPYNNKEFSVGHPALSTDNKTLYFISDMPGGEGGTDLYSSTWDGGKWGTPKNLGKGVNTQGDESFPTVNPNGKLYFSSDGHAGLGGLDVFFTDATFSGVTNVGHSINTMKDDFGLAFTSERGGYFSSNRKRGLADDDIYSFYIAPPIKIRLFVINEITKAPLANTKVLINGIDSAYTDSLGQLVYTVANPNIDHKIVVSKDGYKTNEMVATSAQLKADTDRIFDTTVPLTSNPKTLFAAVVKDIHTNEIIDSAKVMVLNQCTNNTDVMYTDQNGNFSYTLDTACSYVIKVVQEEYFPHCVTFAKKDLPLNVENVSPNKPIYLVKVELNAKLEIKNLYYDLNKSDISPKSTLVLDHLKHLLEEYNNIKVELGSHTDSRASETFNNALSLRRAKSAVAYLTQHGISKSRIRAKAFGEAKLTNECNDNDQCTEEEHQLNRRTEIQVIGFVKPKKNSPRSKNPIHRHDTPLSASDDFSDCEYLKIVESSPNNIN